MKKKRCHHCKSLVVMTTNITVKRENGKFTNITDVRDCCPRCDAIQLTKAEIKKGEVSEP